MKLIINIKCYCEFVICFYFVVVLLNTKMRENAKAGFYSMAVVNDAYAIFMVKTFHHHEEDAVCHSDSGNSHDSSHQCPVCNFTLSPLHKLKHYNFILFFRF